MGHAGSAETLACCRGEARAGAPVVACVLEDDADFLAAQCGGGGDASSSSTEAGAGVDAARRALESLSYTPMRFDAGPTFDADRSHARYAKIGMHRSRVRAPQRRSKPWEEWLRAAVGGHDITLLAKLPAEGAQSSEALTKVSATYYLDTQWERFSIVPTGHPCLDRIAILVDSIQVICPATDFMLFFDRVDEALSEAEKSRAVLVEYASGPKDRRRVCFLEDSASARENFVQALTSLWLDRQHEQALWF